MQVKLIFIRKVLHLASLLACEQALRRALVAEPEKEWELQLRL